MLGVIPAEAGIQASQVWDQVAMFQETSDAYALDSRLRGNDTKT